MRVAIFPFGPVSTSNLEEITRSVIPGGRLRTKGRSENRYKSYLAGRCAIKALYKEINAPFLVSVNSFYGFLEVLDASGKKQKDCFVNVTHTEEISVAVLSDYSVGIDIESKTRSAEKVLERVATEREKVWAKEKKGQDILLWSAKEAAAKAFGLGMKFGLQAFEILPDDSGNLSKVITHLKTPLKLKEPLLIQESFESFVISICSEKSSVLGGVHRRILNGGDLEGLR